MELLFKFIRNLGILIIEVILVLIIMVSLVGLIQEPWNYLSSGYNSYNSSCFYSILNPVSK